jgi:hypothetical protein
MKDLEKYYRNQGPNNFLHAIKIASDQYKIIDLVSKYQETILLFFLAIVWVKNFLLAQRKEQSTVK